MIHNPSTEIIQVGKFGLIGIINTIIDFLLFNTLTTNAIGLSKVKANLISTTAAMIFSFFANRGYVFQPGTQNPVIQALLFFIVTAFGLYVLQNIIIHYLAETWTWPRHLATRVINRLRLRRLMTADFAVKNSAKVIATIVSLTWNYIMYGKVVFR